jgi:hypothetical protein
LITINQKSWFTKNNPGYRKSCSVRIFFSEQHQVLNEQTIIQKEGKTIKPDRMVVTKDKEVFYWIIKQAFMILNIKNN